MPLARFCACGLAPPALLDFPFLLPRVCFADLDTHAPSFLAHLLLPALLQTLTFGAVPAEAREGAGCRGERWTAIGSRPFGLWTPGLWESNQFPVQGSGRVIGDHAGCGPECSESDCRSPGERSGGWPVRHVGRPERPCSRAPTQHLRKTSFLALESAMQRADLQPVP